ncbi:MAG: hypothetical protein PW843_10855 [Azospirillaceae bacterium]|nr:hypothetical protein [Azospirillaceae bacterium]
MSGDVEKNGGGAVPRWLNLDVLSVVAAMALVLLAKSGVLPAIPW